MGPNSVAGNGSITPPRDTAATSTIEPRSGLLNGLDAIWVGTRTSNGVDTCASPLLDVQPKGGIGPPIHGHVPHEIQTRHSGRDVQWHHSPCGTFQEEPRIPSPGPVGDELVLLDVVPGINLQVDSRATVVLAGTGGGTGRKQQAQCYTDAAITQGASLAAWADGKSCHCSVSLYNVSAIVAGGQGNVLRTVLAFCQHPALPKHHGRALLQQLHAHAGGGGVAGRGQPAASVSRPVGVRQYQAYGVSPVASHHHIEVTLPAAAAGSGKIQHICVVQHHGGIGQRAGLGTQRCRYTEAFQLGKRRIGRVDVADAAQICRWNLLHRSSPGHRCHRHH
ncbi:hypothetical protein G6F31_014171 [Rhizopus arrhizus]|nr:hypothetical protein G6F31_014171 [Rhizopus arrhizus]